MAVRLQDGIASLDGNVDARTVTVWYDESATDARRVRSVFRDVGYPPEE